MCGDHRQAKTEQKRNIYVRVGAPEDLPWADCRLHGMGDRLDQSSVEGNHVWHAESARLAHSLLLHHAASCNESLLLVSVASL